LEPTQESGKSLEEGGVQTANKGREKSSPSGPPPGLESIVTSKRKPTKGSTKAQTSIQSSDNIRHLAKESLHIGNVMGLQVVQNEKAAKVRIRRMLKNNRKGYSENMKLQQ